MRRRTFIKKLTWGTGALFMTHELSFANKSGGKIAVQMIYNNIIGDTGLKSAWGLSLWIDFGKDAVLFDTGGEPEVLWHNIQTCRIDLNKLSTVIISHNHWDHINGLGMILEKTDYKPVVYIPEMALRTVKQKHPKANLKGINEAQMIREHLWTTGQLKGSYKSDAIYEQAVFIINNGSLYIFTGCSHPGIVEIVAKVKQTHPEKQIEFAAGGFHLGGHTPGQLKDISVKLRKLDVKKIAPSHCTGDQAIEYFKEEWNDRFFEFYLRNRLEIPV
ncbi:MAG: MBL fold metallo-hydrolase [Calditrichaceae bacterium]|nr:MBL fold metallo-hydrolase [Calditrichaceae bacterium]